MRSGALSVGKFKSIGELRLQKPATRSKLQVSTLITLTSVSNQRWCEINLIFRPTEDNDA